MNSQFLVVFPPLIVVGLVALTRQVIPAIATGIVVAALVSCQFDVMAAAKTAFDRFILANEIKNLSSWSLFWTSERLFVCLFLLALGVFIMLLRQSGGAYAYGSFVSKRLKSPVAAQLASLFLSLFFFIDDYFSSLTVGSVMQPITDRFKVPRVKLALLVNAIAAPLATLVPMTSWVAFIMAQMRNSGIAVQAKDGVLVVGDLFTIYLNIIPFLLYPILVVTATWFFVIKKYSFGIFALHEKIAEATGNLFAGKIPVARQQISAPIERQNNGSIVDFIVPLVIFLGAVFILMLRTGNYWLLDGNNDLVAAMQQANTFISLMLGSVIAVLLSFVFLFFRKRILINEVPLILKDGFDLMGSTIIVLLLIWTFSGLVTYDLKTGEYLAQFFIGNVSISYLPVMFFIIAALVSVMMGTVWGTMMMLFPLGIPLVVSMSTGQPPLYVDQIMMLYPVLAAIISGAVVGNHLSPISDVMLMSAASSGAYHMDVYRAQVSFSLPSIVASIVGFAIIGVMLQPYGWYVSIVVALAVSIAFNMAVLAFLSFRASIKKS